MPSQRDVVSTFVSVTQLDILFKKGASGQIPAMFVLKRNEYFKPKHDLYLSSGRCLLSVVPKSDQIISTVFTYRQHKAASRGDEKLQDIPGVPTFVLAFRLLYRRFFFPPSFGC